MSLPRVRIWWLMVLVAGVAAGCWGMPRWWRWHHRMLERSKHFLRMAERDEAAVAAMERVLGPTPRTATGDVVDYDALIAEARKDILQWRRIAAYPWTD